MTISITREDHTADQLRAEAAHSRDGCVARRLLGLPLALEGLPRWQAAAMCGMDRQTLGDWVHRYNAEGVAGLCDRPSAFGPAAKLSEDQQAALAAWVEAGPDPGCVRTDGRCLAGFLRRMLRPDRSQEACRRRRWHCRDRHDIWPSGLKTCR